MTSSPGDAPTGALQAEQTLERLSGQVASMRTVLVRLLQDIVVAETRLDKGQAEQLVLANEHLVLAALRGQADAETASVALDLAHKSAEHDVLTELPNRLLLLDRFKGAIANVKRHGSGLSLLFIDIDNFKEINDTLGHAVGDETLKAVARCLSSAVRAGDTVSRHGGDEFLVLLAEIAHGPDALLVANKMLALLNQPQAIAGHRLRLSASIGISVYPDDGDDPLVLIERADAAMYRAKRRGPGTARLHTPHEDAGGARTATLRESRTVQQALAAPLVNVATAAAAADQVQQHALLREANEQLVLAALDAQELHDAMRVAQRHQSSFLSAVASELRDPMAPIRLAAAQLGMTPDHKGLLARAQGLIDRQAGHMTRLVSNLLEMVQGHAGRLRFKRETLDLIDVLNVAVSATTPAIRARQQRFSATLPARPLRVHGHAGHLAQVVTNLLDNASKFTPNGGEIGLFASALGANVEIRVHDSGLGLTADALLNVFAPFAQDTHTMGFNGVGIGIGLTVVKELVEAHGGTVVAHSAGPGQGSQFVVTLPVLPVLQVLPALPAAQTAINSPPNK